MKGDHPRNENRLPGHRKHQGKHSIKRRKLQEKQVFARRMH